MEALSSFHLSTPKHLQSLPIRTANSAVYLLLGILPISAELHKKQLSPFHQIAMSENVSVREIAWRQYNLGRPASFFIRIVDILDLCELPPFTEVNLNGKVLLKSKSTLTGIQSYNRTVRANHP
jgi:hypothetical protein